MSKELESTKFLEQNNFNRPPLRIELLVSGVFFVLIGGLFLFGSMHYSFGNLRSMGAGYLPTVVSSVLIFLGLIQLFRGYRTLKDPIRIPVYFIRPIIFSALVVLSTLLWPYFGAVLAITIVMLAVAILHEDFSYKTFLLSLIPMYIVLLIFKYGLGSNMVLWNF